MGRPKKNQSTDTTTDTIESPIDFDQLEETVETNDVEQVVPIPEKSDPKWHDYVMGLFLADEIQDGNPTVDGLRRVSQLIYGPIIDERPHTVATPCVDNNWLAVVEYTFRFDNLIVSAVADAGPTNTDAPYNRYPLAMAETRAQGRALRKILGLRKIVSAEELNQAAKEQMTIPNESFVGGISAIQKAAINSMCKRLNINVLKFINSGGQSYNALSDVKSDAAKQMAVELNCYGYDDGHPDKKSIPAEIIGFSGKIE